MGVGGKAGEVDAQFGHDALRHLEPSAAEQMTPLFLLAGLGVGLILGAINGVLISVVGITPILATLGTMQLYNGLALVWTGGVTISAIHELERHGLRSMLISAIETATHHSEGRTRALMAKWMGS